MLTDILERWDARTGVVRWRWTGDGPGYASPIIVTREGVRQIVTQTQKMCVGIAAENLQRVMEPLYSTKARGLGLGLAIARSILEKNNGSLRVLSEPGRGTTFAVRLTAAE